MLSKILAFLGKVAKYFLHEFLVPTFSLVDCIIMMVVALYVHKTGSAWYYLYVVPGFILSGILHHEVYLPYLAKK